MTITLQDVEEVRKAEQRLMARTRFPIKSLPILRALGQDLAPVPVPDIVVAPVKPNEFKAKKNGTGGSRADAMEID
jgi:hypothetical protein